MWLALNKIDLIDDQDLEDLVNELKIQYEGILNIYCISAAKKVGTQQLMREIGTFMESSDE
jgi:50S ribosomal subunit-associated GTPase HflX